jgi:hypothetical protein
MFFQRWFVRLRVPRRWHFGNVDDIAIHWRALAIANGLRALSVIRDAVPDLDRGLRINKQ